MALNEILGNVSGFVTGDFEVIRTSTGVRRLGRSEPGSTETLLLRLGIEPITGRALRDLPQGRRADETIKVFSPIELRTVSPEGDCDVISYLGERWTVTSVERWTGFGQEHYEARATRAPSPRGSVP